VVALAIAGALLSRTQGVHREAPPTYFAQAQSFIADLNGAPVVSANWGGRFRPYLFREGEYRPLMPPGLEGGLEGVDLYSPTPATPGQIVMAGQTAGGRNFDVYVYDLDARALRNVTESPAVDDGDFCVERSSGLLAFRSGVRQRFVRVDGAGVSSIAELAGPGFNRCIWTSPEELIGVRGRRPPYQLSTCSVRAPRVVCTPSAALSDVDHFVDFFLTDDRRVGVVARKRAAPFRRAYYLSGGGLADVGERDFPLGDVVEYDGTHARMGLHSKYWTTAERTPDDAITLFKMKRVGDRYVAIAADSETNKTLAELRDGAWRLVPPAGWTAPDHAGRPLEIWLRARSGHLHQAIYVGPLAPTRVVLWIHGGPRENVSARFNPYFQWLNDQGFGVLALNYPGSTGRGARYESRFGAVAVADALQAALDYLWAHQVEQVVSWSISAGHGVQRVLLAHRFGLSGMIDQAGGDPGTVKVQAAQQRIPYLSISGVHDRGGDDAAVDVSYPGGHDITFEPDFRMVLERVGPFLRNAPPWRYRTPPALRGELILDPAHTGNARDPNRHRGLAEAELTFQLAHALMRDCVADRPVIVTRTGHPTLEETPAASVRARARFLDAHPEAKLLSLHFNASSKEERSDNLTSAFVPSHYQDAETHLAGELVAALEGLGIGPKLTYPELAKVPLERLAPGVFARDLYLLHRSSHVRPAPPRVLFEVAYYDDEAENRRLQERVLSADGTWVRPRIEEMAAAMCPTVLEFFGDARSR
jgi:hypothetical protein